MHSLNLCMGVVAKCPAVRLSFWCRLFCQNAKSIIMQPVGALDCNLGILVLFRSTILTRLSYFKVVKVLWQASYIAGLLISSAVLS